MHYDDRVYRPPQEARTLLLQVTYGCSHNKCTYCSMYQGVKFRMSPMEEIISDLEECKKYYPNVDRIFLLNGDAFCLSAKKLKELSILILKYLPNIKTITMYASIINIVNKTVEELKELRELGINDLYIGLETGNEQALKDIIKGSNAQDALIEMKKLEEAGISYKVMVLTGIMGKGKGVVNAVDTGKLLSQLNPKGVFALSTVVVPGTKLYEQIQSGEFIEASEYERIIEIKTLAENLTFEKETKFYATHPSNLISIKSKFPKDKDDIVRQLDHILETTTEEEVQFDRSKLIGHM